MSSLIVPIATIDALFPHPNAERLELAQVLGWQMIVPKDTYQVNDKVVYIPIDTVLPQEFSDKLNVTQYLSKQRVRCTKLRGEPSFGLAITPDEDWPVGENVAEYYHLEKYSPPIRTGRGERPEDWLPEHPLFPRYTDIENLRNFPAIFEEDEIVIVTEKLHGSNVRIGMVESELMAGSHRMRRKQPGESEEALLENPYWFPWTLPGVRTFLEAGRDHYKQVILYGEVYGERIQSFHYGMQGQALGFRVFDILVDGKYLDYSRFFSLCQIYGIDTVPLVKRTSFSLEKIKALSEGKTLLLDGEEAHIREGVVIKPLEERTHKKVGRVVMKYVSDSYLFAKKTDYLDA